MYLPNPIAFGLIKTGAYFLFGGLVRTRAGKRFNPFAQALVFSLARSIAGWVVGVIVWIFVAALAANVTDQLMIASLAIPRLILSGFLIHALFRPRGGWWETAVWALLNVALSSGLDLYLFANYQRIDWLRIAWC